MAPSFWAFSYREARVIALILAVILWSLAAVFVFATRGPRSLAGPLKGGDFIQFYTMGASVWAHDSGRLYDTVRFHRLQVALLPESDPERYLVPYPPQAWIVFAPLATVSYGQAAILWSVALVIGYAAVVRATWRRCRDALPDGRFVAIASAAFPPFWSLVLHGQNTVIPLAAFFLAWLALTRGQRFLAGLALGLIFLKPQFGLAVAVVVLAGGEIAMLGGLAAAAALQLAVILSVFDVSVLTDYVDFMRRLSAVEFLIEPKPFELHSIRAVTRLVPGWAGTALWIAASIAVLKRTARVWRSGAPVAVRLAVVVLATVLVSPHLFVYDATVLVLSLLWIGAWVERDPAIGRLLAARFWPVVFWLYAALLIPVARIIVLQPSVFLMLWLHFTLASVVLGRRPSGPSEPAADRAAVGP